MTDVDVGSTSPSRALTFVPALAMVVTLLGVLVAVAAGVASAAVVGLALRAAAAPASAEA